MQGAIGGRTHPSACALQMKHRSSTASALQLCPTCRLLPHSVILSSSCCCNALGIVSEGLIRSA